MTNALRNSGLRGALFLMSTALVTSTAGHQHLISEQRSVMLVSTRAPVLCLPPGSNHKQHMFAGSLKALGTCVTNAPLQGPWVRNSWLSTSKHHVRLQHHTSHISSLRTFCSFQAQLKEMKSTSNCILQIKQQLHFAQNREVLAHSYLKSSFSIVRAFLHAHKHFYMQFYITYARKDPKEKMLVQNTYLAFSYFSALEIPPQLTTSLIKKKIPMQFPVLQTST